MHIYKLLLKLDLGRISLLFEKSISADKEKDAENARTGKGGSSNSGLGSLPGGTKHRAFARLGYD